MRLWAIALIAIFVTGCTGAVNDFVEGGGGTTPSAPLPSADLTSDGGFKLSPGHLTATSSVANMRITITPTEQRFSSSVADVQMSMSAGRPQ